MAIAAFIWDDGSDRFESQLWQPNVERPAEPRGQLVPLLSGGTLYCVQVNAQGQAVIPHTVTLRWDAAPADLLQLAETAQRELRSVTITYPWRDGTDTLTGRVIAREERPGKGRSALGPVVGLTVTLQEVSL